MRSARLSVPGRLLALVAVAALSRSPSCGAGRSSPPRRRSPPARPGSTHLSRDLAPFWLRPEALGSPVGAFPTFRCDDGTLVDPDLPCGELLIAGPWVSSQLGKEFTRMRSRQTFFYGVAFHLTGEERYLALAKAGVDQIRAHALDRADAERRLVVEGRRRRASRRREDLAGPRLREPRSRLLRLPDARPGGPRRRAPPLRRHLRTVRRPVARAPPLGGRRRRRRDGPRSSSSPSSTR